MKRKLVTFGLLAALLATAHAAPSALSEANFVDIGDSVAEMLKASGLVFSSAADWSAGVQSGRYVKTAFHPAMPAAHVQTLRHECPGGGSVKVVLHDTDRDGRLSQGDRTVTEFDACKIAGNGPLSGRSEFKVAGHRFEGFTEITELDFSFTRFGTPAMHWSGPAHVTLHTDLRRGTEQFKIAYRDLAVTRADQPMRWSFSMSVTRPPIGESVASVDGAMSWGMVKLQLKQDEPYVYADTGVPRAGQLSAHDEAGSSLQIEARRRRYAYRLFLAGSRKDLPDFTSHSKPYREL